MNAMFQRKGRPQGRAAFFVPKQNRQTTGLVVESGRRLWMD